MRFLDTNILLYSISDALDEKRKHHIALELLAARDNALSVQVLQEFYVQATRSTRQHALGHEVALGLIRSWLRFPVQDITLALMSQALEIRARFGLSYWDAAVVAAADALRCDELLSEDLSHGQMILGVRITNPFH